MTGRDLVLWFDQDDPGRRWEWECEALDTGARSRHPDLRHVLADLTAQTASADPALRDALACMSEPGVLALLDRVAAAVPREPVVFDTGRGDENHWAETTVWHVNGRWDCEFLALEPNRNTSAEHVDLTSALTAVLDRVEDRPG